VILISSDSDFEWAVGELVSNRRRVTVVGFTTPGNHILCRYVPASTVTHHPSPHPHISRPPTLMD
jgi:hypothetical protein